MSEEPREEPVELVDGSEQVRPAASVIVRARNEQRTIARTLESLHCQTIRPEIIVVDSGSTDRTLEIARGACDLLIQIPPETFTYGRALNIGAEAASAEIHFALSAHCYPERDDWVELAVAHYARTEVAAVGGETGHPDGTPLVGTFDQRAADAREKPRWGFSNHASSWRASIWRDFRFDERLDYAEDKEWAWRVLHAGWVITYDSALWVDLSHQWRTSVADYYGRQKRAARALDTFSSMPPYRLEDCLSEWWNDLPEPRRRGAFVHRFLNYRRTAGLVGKYVGHRGGRVASPSSERAR